MDTSPEYIRMCEKAVEIQEHAKTLSFGEYYCAYYGIERKCPKCKNWVDTTYCGWCKTKIKETEKIYTTHRDQIPPKEEFGYIWLPRQDQLQEMVDDPEIRWKWDLIGRWFERLPAKVTAYYLGYGRGQTKYPDTKGLGSDEQLWLAFVMSEKFNKTWSGTDWE